MQHVRLAPRAMRGMVAFVLSVVVVAAGCSAAELAADAAAADLGVIDAIVPPDFPPRDQAAPPADLQVATDLGTPADGECIATWKVMASPTSQALFGVWGVAGDQLWAVGATGAMLRHDGSGWKTQSSSGQLLSLWGTSKSNVYAVGCAVDNCTPFSVPRVMHYDGASWTEFPAPDGVPLVSNLWGPDASTLFATGPFGSVFRLDVATKKWTSQFSGYWAYWGIWGFGKNDVFVVGNGGSILHYDGTKWSETLSGTVAHLMGVWGSSPCNVYAVGGPQYVGGPATIVHFDGTDWSVALEKNHQRLNDIWGTGQNDIFVVGEQGSILHFAGSVWSEMASGTQDELIDIWGFGPQDVYAVGDKGTILHYSCEH